MRLRQKPGLNPGLLGLYPQLTPDQQPCLFQNLTPKPLKSPQVPLKVVMKSPRLLELLAKGGGPTLFP